MHKTVNRRQLMTLVILTSLVSACSTFVDQSSGTPESDTPQLGQSVRAGSVRVDTDDEEIARFWQASERARREDNDVVAMELLYQALEIDPQSAILWSRAAEIQLDNDQPVQAENFANKSNTFAGENRALMHRNWLIIEHARNLRGDLLGVRSAHRKVQEYQYP